MNQAFWNDIMIVTTTFVVVSRSVAENSLIDVNNVDQSIIKIVENVDYFESIYVNLTNIDQFIVNVKRQNFYRDVYIFIDHLRNLKTIISNFRIKKLIVVCFKKKALRWYNVEFTKIKKDYFREIFIDRWCVNLIKRFKERTFVILKKLQTKSYIYVDARRDRKLRFYMQNILRHFKTTNYASIFHQCIIVWNNLELNFRTQISKSSKDIILSVFLNQLNVKKNVWMNMIFRHKNADNIFSSFEIDNNNVNRTNRFNKQNRKRQNNFNQQSFVDFFSDYMWSSSSYNLYQYKNPAYQN